MIYWAQVKISPAVDDRTAEVQQRIVYSFEQVAWLEGWWSWALGLAAVGLILWLMVRLYRRDTHELRPAIRGTLIMLRTATLLGLVFFFLGVTRRAQQMVTRQSEVAVLVDTSQSMSLPAANEPGVPTRSEVAAKLIRDGQWIEQLAQQQRVTIYAFDEGDELRELELRVPSVQTRPSVTPESLTVAKPRPASRLAVIGLVLVVGSLGLSLTALFLGASGRATTLGQPLFAAAALLILGGILSGATWSVASPTSWLSLLGWGAAEQPAQTVVDPVATETEAETDLRRVVDWEQALQPAGKQTRIGDAIRDSMQRHDSATLAGLVLITDGQNNAGLPATTAATLAARAGVAIYPIGLGSSEAPINVRIVDLDAPRRVYPGDKFSLSAVLQASGPSDLNVQVQLLDGLDQTNTPLEVIDVQEAVLPVDGRLTGVRFELEPEEVGRRRLAVRVVAPASDQNPDDNYRDTRYEVVSRKLRVLAIAGGPTREYQFVRNLLYRDESTRLDVWLQTGQPGMSQDADGTLTKFPDSAEELFEYDTIIAFDPDWLQMDAPEFDLLERWLSEQAGGLILIGGPVYMPQWMSKRTDPRVAKLAGFFPVNIATSSPLLRGGRAGGDTQWPLDFTSEGLRAEFLWVTDEPQSSIAAWEESGGVFDFVGMKDPKPGARVYAHFSDPTTAIGDSLPVYLASQFYGAGRVFFQGSGEMWRLRAVSDAYFDNYYTKLCRWASEGRLLRDSNRGLLLVDRPRAMVGDSIMIRAVLTDEQFEPLQVPAVEVDVLGPSDRPEKLRLTPAQGEPRAGTYSGRLLVREAGSYDLRLTLGDALREQVLQESIQVRLPTLELERPRRNDEELRSLAAITGGEFIPIDYPPGSNAAVPRGTDAVEGLAQQILPQPQTSVLPGTPDRDFAERTRASMMWLLAACLTFEWVVRRLHRLA